MSYPKARVHGKGGGYDLETLAKINGAMWTARLDIPFGPRPNQPDNILAMDYYEHFNASDRKRMIEKYKSYGYTHAVTGPIVDADGYHGQYPQVPQLPTQESWDHYLDAMQEWEDARITPVHFVHPDNWTYEEMEQLVPFYQQERAQRLLPIIVWTGWEPAHYEWTNSYWCKMVKRGNEVMPNALHLIHTVTDVDAPTGGDDDHTFPAGTGNVKSWENMCPLIHGWLIQFGGYVYGNSPLATPEFKENFRKAFDETAGRDSFTARFRHGLAGWPTFSAWGPDKPIRLYAAEFAAYGDYWQNWPEEEARKLGDIAMATGADGVLDGRHNS